MKLTSITLDSSEDEHRPMYKKCPYFRCALWIRPIPQILLYFAVFVAHFNF